MYRAKHRELGPVAIKEYLPTELAVREGQSVHPVNTDSRGFFEEGLDRFLDEAKQLIRFRTHPSIVSCRDFFRANGTAYLVMDLEEGMSLSELLQARETEGRPFDETDLLTVMVPLLEGLDLVHKAGVLHRDIKPANILIRREDDHPVLIDFGAAKQEFAQHSKSLAPFSPGYAAIEQVAEGRLGAWTDMYGIGAVMWRMVAGGNRAYEPPHPVRVERRVHAKFQGEPDPMPSAQTLGKGRFSQSILAAIDQCLELREADRVQGCKELLQRLRQARKPTPGIAEATAKERQDDREAVKWFRMAAEQGDANAQFNLGFMYATGTGVPQDNREAVKWYRLAAEQGLANAQDNLGFMYATGTGVPENNREAVKWFRMAAKQGDANAQDNLGLAYTNGEGVPQDNISAYAWMSLAAIGVEINTVSARTHLALLRLRMTADQVDRAQRLSSKLFRDIEGRVRLTV